MCSPAERFDIFDEHNRLIGSSARAEVHKHGHFHRSVHVLVFDTRGRLLVQRRSAAKDVCPGRWDLSVAEHLQPAEQYAAAAVRGLHEELGLCVQMEELQRVKEASLHEVKDDAAGIWDREFNETYVLTRRLTEQDVSALRRDPAEVEAIDWWSVEQLHAAHVVDSITPWFHADIQRLKHSVL